MLKVHDFPISMHQSAKRSSETLMDSGVLKSHTAVQKMKKLERTEETEKQKRLREEKERASSAVFFKIDTDKLEPKKLYQQSHQDIRGKSCKFNLLSANEVIKNQPARSPYCANAHPNNVTIRDQNWQRGPILAANADRFWQLILVRPDSVSRGTQFFVTDHWQTLGQLKFRYTTSLLDAI